MGKITKEEILQVSVRLFAERGFDAVSTSMIAGELGITKGALYRHFSNKQEIFDCLLQKMVELDRQRAQEDHVPTTVYDQDAESYQKTVLSDLCAFVNHQFLFWTEHPFACLFRRMITLEQFKNGQMRKLYQDVIAMGPVQYTADILREMLAKGLLNDAAKAYGPWNMAVEMFAPLQLLIQLYDGGADIGTLQESLRTIMENFEKRWIS